MASYSAEVLADSPLLYVRFEETAGATCANSGSLGSNATAAGTFARNIATGLAGLNVGIDLGAASGIVTYPDTASLDITGDVTYECWVNADSLQTGVLISKGSSGGGAGYEVQIRTGGVFRILKSATSVILTSVTGTYSAGTWTHFAFTRSGNNYTIYVNGSSTDTVTDSTAMTATASALCIGGQDIGGGPAAIMDGKIDEVAVYNTALSGARIAAHYAARNTGASTTWNGSSTVSLTDTITTAGTRVGVTRNGSSTTALTVTVTTVSRAVTLHGSSAVSELVTVTTAGALPWMILVPRPPDSLVLVPVTTPLTALTLAPR